MARAPLTWKTVQRDGGAEKALALAAQAGRDIGSAFDSAGETLTGFGEKKTDTETDAFIANLMSMGSDSERQAAIAEADKSFLDLGRVAERTYELGADERALETQLNKEQRDLTAQIAQEGREQEYESSIFDRDVKYEEDINQREIDEAKIVLGEEQKREDFLTMKAEKREDELRLMKEMQDENLLDKGFGQDKELLNIRFKEERKINDLEFSRARSNIVTEYKLRAKNAEAAAVTKAAGEQAVAEIEKERDIEIAKIEAKENEAIKTIEKQAKIDELALKNAAKEGSYLEKIYNRATVNGAVDDVKLDSASQKAMAAVEIEMTQSRGIQPEAFSEYMGDNVNYVDNPTVLGIAGAFNPNEFEFEFRGQSHRFGKKGFGGLPIGAFGGTSETVMNHLEAAILQSKNDKLVYDASFSEYRDRMKEKGINVTEDSHRRNWANYVQEIRLKPASVNGYLQSLVPLEERDGTVPGDQILLYKQNDN